MSREQPLELVILDGEQEGARAILMAGNSIEIGASLDSDIVLRDPLVDSQKVKLNVEGESAKLDILAGEVKSMGQSFIAGQSIELPLYQAVKIGGTTFAYGESNSTLWQHPHREPVDQAPLFAGEHDSKSTQDLLAQQNNAWLKKGAFLTGLLLLLTLPIAMATGLLRGSGEKITIDSRAKQATSLVLAQGFSGIAVAVDETQQELVVTGYLDSYQERQQLEVALNESDIFARLDVQVGESLVNRVKDIYRLNGVSAEVELQGQGVVLVKTSELDAEKLKRVEAVIYNDISQVKEVIAENDVSEIDSQSLAQSSGFNVDTGAKRITMIVKGDTPYIVTSDRSRYYIGALLPSGHKVKEIGEKQVILVKNNEITELNL